MGFLNRLRGGATYGPPRGADDTQLPATPSTQPGGSSGEHVEAPAGDTALPAAPGRGTHALFAMMHRTTGQRTTAAERAFMDLKRGSSD